MKKLVLLSVILMAQNVSANDPTCSPSVMFDFEKSLEKISAPLKKPALKDGFYLTPYNLKIEENCSKNFKISDLEKTFRTAMAEGTMCLSKLAQYGSLGSQNNACLIGLFENKTNPPKILCGGWPFGDDFWAVGSFPGSSKRHPYLWISPKISAVNKSDPNEVKATIFHEMLHNCGFTHSEGIEVAYTCEECCFNKKLDASKRESACRICGGKYKDEFSLDYQKDLLQWSEGYPTWGRDMRRSVFMASLKKKSTESFEHLLSYISTNENEKKLLQTIFLATSAQNRNSLILEFERTNTSSLSSNVKLKQLIDWFKTSHDLN